MNAAAALAVTLDRVFGEPPPALHPVVWMGRYCAWAGRRMARVDGARRQAVAGGVATVAGTVAAALAGAALQRWIARLPRPLALLTEATALSTLLSAAMLEREVVRVFAAVAGAPADEPSALAAARAAVAGLVSRDVAALDAGGVREAALESLAENASDAIVAPLWWYAAAGLPAAAAYRFVNTADAMWGYRTSTWEWRGKVVAGADDLANWWPARLTALLLAPRAGVTRVAGIAAVTASPNAGWPMGALALRLDVRLGKAGAYLLHPRGRPPRAEDVGPAIHAVRRVTAAATVCATLVARPVR